VAIDAVIVLFVFLGHTMTEQSVLAKSSLSKSITVDVHYVSSKLK